MKKISKIVLAFMMLVAVFALAGCSSKTAEVNLADYVKYTYEGYDGLGTGSATIDARKIVKDVEEQIGDEKASNASKLLKKIEIELEKTENLSNGEKIMVYFNNVKEQELLDECGLTVIKDGFETQVTGLQELEEVDLFADYDITYYGNDTVGSGYVSDYDFPDGVYGIYLELSKTKNLSNGEKIKVMVKSYDEDKDIQKDLASLGKKAKALEQEITVSGLTELKEYDVFQGLYLEYTGLNGQATARVRFDYSQNEYYYSFEYILDKEEALANGDVVTVSCDIDDYYKDEYTLEEYAANRGLKLAATTKEITVEGILQPIMDIADIDNAKFEAMKAADYEKIKDTYTNGVENLVEANSFYGARYIGSFITFKDSSYYDYPNVVYNVYKCDVNFKGDEPRWVYWFAGYSAVRNETTGLFELSDTDIITPLDKYYKSYYEDSNFACIKYNNDLYYLGFSNVDDIVTGFTNNYRGASGVEAIFNNIADTEDEHGPRDGVEVIPPVEVTPLDEAIDVSKISEATGAKAWVYDPYGVYTQEQAEAILEKIVPITEYDCDAYVIITSLENVDADSFKSFCDSAYAEYKTKDRVMIYAMDAATLKDYMYTFDGESGVEELEPAMDGVPYSLRSENPYEYTIKIFDTLLGVLQ